MRSTGALVLNLFAALWAVLALHALNVPMWQQASPIALSALLIIWAMSRPAIAGTAEYRKRVRTTVLWSSAAEGVLIFLAINALRNMGRDDLVVAAVAAIVGLHFYPMAIGMRLPFYALTGTAMMVLAGAAAYFLPAGAERDAVIGGGCALVLWMSSIALMQVRARVEVTA